MLVSYVYLYAFPFAFILVCILFYTNNNFINKNTLLKYLVIAYTINILLKAPMHLLCAKLEIMWVYYLWCGIVGCMVISTISNIKNNEVQYNGGYYIKRFFLISFILTFNSHMIYIGTLLYIYIVIPDYFQIISLEYWKEHWHLLKMNLDPLRGIIPEDPENQLTNTGYNRNGTNQPIASNIAHAMDVSYSNFGSALTYDMLPANVQRFLLNYLLDNDRARYDKIMTGVNLDNGDKPK